jgi:hypothetical protein
MPVLKNPANRGRAIALTFDQFKYCWAHLPRTGAGRAAVSGGDGQPEPMDRGEGDPNRGHALTIDSGWREVADTALAFVKRFV